MVAVRPKAAPPTPWSKNLAEPQIDESAYVHSFANLIGDVKVGADVLIAPGTSIRADEGTPFSIGKSSKIQDGVVIHGLEQGRVIGDDGQPYSVWIGKEACITHLALIHGPAYIGDRTFIGFRSTVFNARVGHDCIVMMHALIQDVEIPPGKYVPSGAVITNQQQADQLPDVTSTDQKFVHHVVEINQALKAVQSRSSNATNNPLSDQLQRSNASNPEAESVKANNYENSVGKMSVSSEIVDQVRSLLNQGCKFGIEYADQRRFRSKSWLSDQSLQGYRVDQVISELESRLAAHPNEYVRLIGVDPQAKKRVLETIVQRPGQASVQNNGRSSFSSSTPSYSNNSNGAASKGLDGATLAQIRSLLNQGYRIGMEHADQRHFRAKSWQSCQPIQATRENDVIAALEGCLKEHQGEYVRLIGIDPKAKRRVLETIVQRPGDSSNQGSRSSYTATASTYRPSGSSNGATVGLDGETLGKIRSLLSQGYKIGTEHADQRHFRAKSWQSCQPIETTREPDVIAALEDCLKEHQGEYVRLIGIDSKARKRVLEAIIQRPGNNGAVATASNTVTSTNYGRSSASNGSAATVSYSSGLSTDTLQKVRSLLSQGYQIGTEHADQRHFRAKSWQSCQPIQTTREADVIAALEGCLREHQGEYVRLIGIDSKARKRVSETIIQRP